MVASESCECQNRIEKKFRFEISNLIAFREFVKDNQKENKKKNLWFSLQLAACVVQPVQPYRTLSCTENEWTWTRNLVIGPIP